MSEVSRRISWAWACGGLSVACYLGITINFLLYFLTEAHAISAAYAGIALLLPRIWDVVTDPLMGAISDRTNSRWGRRRPYVLVGGIAFGVFFFLMCAIPEFDSEVGKLIYFTVLYVLVSTAYTVYEVPLLAMSAEMTQDFHARTMLIGQYVTVIRVGLVFVAAAGPFVFSSLSTLSDGFALLGAIAGLIMVFSAVIVFWGTKEAAQSEAIPHRLEPMKELRAVWTNRPFITLAVAYLFQNIGIGAQATTLIYFLVFVFQAPAESVGLIVALVTITAAVFTPIWVVVARRFGKPRAYLLGLSMAAAMQAAIFVVNPGRYAAPIFGADLGVTIATGFVLLTLMMVVGAIGDSAMVMLPRALVPDTVEVDELKTGIRREGTLMGALSFCRKLGMTCGAFLVSVGLTLSGFESGAVAQEENARTGLLLLYTLCPAAFYFIAVLLFRGYDLTETRFNAIKDELRIARSKA